MKKIGSIFETTVKYAVFAMAIIFSAMMLYFSVKGTTYVDLMENVTYGGDNDLTNVFVCVGVALFFFFMTYFKGFAKLERALSRPKTFLIVYCVLLAILVAMATAWVCLTDFKPWADSYWTHEAAVNFLKGDYSDFAPGGYIDMCPWQGRMVIFFAGIDTISGGFNLKVYSAINAVFFILFWIGIERIVSLLTNSKLSRIATLAAGICWVPMLLYISFLYGNLIAISTFVWAVYLWLSYFETHKLWKALTAGVCISVSFCFKAFAAVVLIAMFIYGLGKIFVQKKTLSKTCWHMVLLQPFSLARYLFQMPY